METTVATNLNPAYTDLYLGALREEGLSVYTKELNIDGWIRVDIYLVYDEDEELARAKGIVDELERG